MPRNAWAKVYCDLLRHPKIIGRPDSDIRLFLGLILYAKEFSLDSGVVPLNANAMKLTFGIKAPLRQVEAGISYFVECGVLVREGDARVRIRDFAERQKPVHDSPEAVRERQRRWRENNGRSNGTSNGKVTGHVTVPVTETRLTREVEEEERKNDLRGGYVGGNPQQPVDNSDLTGLTDSDKAQFQRLIAEGKGTEAVALLASLRAAQVQGTIQKSPEPEAQR